ncbi:MAG: alpha/beta hydrolase [Candidatus Hydrogenedentota bacterium]
MKLLIKELMTCALLLAAVSVSAEPSPSYERERVLYAEPDGSPQRMTLYLPEWTEEEGGERRPAMVLMHGGAWTFGWRQQLDWFCEQLAEHGYVAATIDYRTMPGGVFPNPLHDAKAAVRWLRLNAEQYAIDPGRIGALGRSAGGHLAAFLAVTGDSGLFEGGENPGASSAVQAAVCFYAPFDLTFYEDHEDEGVTGWVESKIVEYFISAPNDYERDGMTPAEAASPIRYAGPDSSPMLFIHGGEDGMVPVEQSQAFHERLKELGVPTELIVVPEQRHGFTRYPSQAREEVFDDVIAFLDRHLGSPQPISASSAENAEAREPNS